MRLFQGVTGTLAVTFAFAAYAADWQQTGEAGYQFDASRVEVFSKGAVSAWLRHTTSEGERVTIGARTFIVAYTITKWTFRCDSRYWGVLNATEYTSHGEAVRSGKTDEPDMEEAIPDSRAAHLLDFFCTWAVLEMRQRARQ